MAIFDTFNHIKHLNQAWSNASVLNPLPRRYFKMWYAKMDRYYSVSSTRLYVVWSFVNLKNSTKIKQLNAWESDISVKKTKAGFIRTWLLEYGSGTDITLVLSEWFNAGCNTSLPVKINDLGPVQHVKHKSGPQSSSWLTMYIIIICQMSIDFELQIVPMELRVSAPKICNVMYVFNRPISQIPQGIPDSKVHGANMGSTWPLSAPDGPHAGPMNLAIRD